MEKFVIRSKLAFTSHFVLTVLGKHWSNDIMQLTDCYRVPRFDTGSDLLGGGDVVDRLSPIVAGALLCRRPLPVLLVTRLTNTASVELRTTT